MRTDRALWVALGALILAAGAFVLYERGPGALPFSPGCVFKKATGLDCPGCGMTRAAYATLHGRLGEAFRFNPVGMVLLPLAMTGVGIELAGWVRGKPLPFRLSLGKWGGWWLAGVLIAFWILRNIPYWPFTLLAPP